MAHSGQEPVKPAHYPGDGCPQDPPAHFNDLRRRRWYEVHSGIEPYSPPSAEAVRQWYEQVAPDPAKD